MASRNTPAPRRGATQGEDRSADPSQRDRARGIRAAVLGGAVTVLAPLFGFLGGSMAGTSGAPDGLDPLVAWLIGGMLVGGLGGIVAILGLLRWARTSTRIRASGP